MNNPVFLAVISLCFFLTPALAQRPAPDEGVVKITTNLVQLDAVVTDKDGRQVRDLTAADFTLLQDGKPQKITSFSYVNTETGSAQTARSGSSSGIAATPTIAGPRVPGSTGRMITFVLDDGNCLLTQIGMIAAKEGLQKFINEQMLPDDRVAIYQTRSGSSMLQQYTSDKNLLLRAARKIRWYPPASACGGPGDGSLFAAAKPNTYDKLSVDPSRANETRTIESGAERKIREGGEDLNRSNQVVGTLGVLRYIVRGLERVPGRKVLFFMSDGMLITDRDGKTMNSRTVLGDLTDLANRSSVVVNTIDIRGVFNPSMIEARDYIQTRDDARATEPYVKVRTDAVRDSRDGLAFLAGETGGRFYYDQNYLDNPVRQALALETGYYLIGYEPDDETFKGKNFNRIEVKVSRPDLNVHSRAGFLGSTAEPAKPKRKSENSELYEALIAPVPNAGLGLRLTAYFGNGAAEGNYVRSLTHLDGNAITFVNEGGMMKASFDVVAVTMNEKNDVVDEFTRAHQFKIDPAAIPLIKRNGLVYTTDVPIKKAGTYNFRVAIRDTNSRLLGSASQVLEIPDVKKGALVLSALTVAPVDQKGKFSIPAAVKPEEALSIVDSNAVPAIRRFRRGGVLAYAYTLYNARTDKTLNKPSLTVKVDLYHDGKLMTAFEPVPADLAPHSDWARINDFGYLRLGPEMPKGEYALQVTVTDLLAPKGSGMSRQWVDFEIEN